VAEPKDELESASSTLSRGDLLRRGGAAAFALSMFGGLSDKAFGFYGPLRYAHKQLAGDLRIMTWAHFVPSYDQWLDNTYVKQWGEANDVEVKVDHINNALLYSTGAAEVAAQSGHDLFWFISPPSTFQKQAIPMTDLVQEVSRKLGPLSRVARKATYNPKTKQFYGFPETYAPDPVQYRKSFFEQTGVSLNTWEDVRKGAPKLKAIGHPVGLGMSNEIDSNMFLTSLLYCYGGFIQNEENRIVIGQGANRKGAIEALKTMRDIYKNGMSDEVFAWTAASNNQAFLAGRLSLAVNAISIARSAELSGNTTLSDDTWLRPIPRGPVRALGNEHVMGVYFIWRFAQNKEAAKKYILDQQLAYRDHFVNSGFYNFPAWTNAIRGGFPAMNRMAAADKHKPRGKYTILTTIARRYTTNVGYPGFANAAVGDIFNQFLIPQMFAQVAQGKMTPENAARSMQGQFRSIYAKWRAQGLL
jgi:multiple sugar transport system substrate-binding protein